MDGRSASEKEGRFCKIKKVVSFSSDGLKRHKVLVVLDQVRREGETEKQSGGAAATMNGCPIRGEREREREGLTEDG